MLEYLDVTLPLSFDHSVSSDSALSLLPFEKSDKGNLTEVWISSNDVPTHQSFVLCTHFEWHSVCTLPVLQCSSPVTVFVLLLL